MPGSVYEGIADLPELDLRHRPDPAGRYRLDHLARLPVAGPTRPVLGGDGRRERAGEPPAGRGAGAAPAGCEHKLTTHPHWPSFTSDARPVDPVRVGVLSQNDRHPSAIRGHHARPEVTRRDDADDIVAAIRKVYPAVARA